MHFVDSWPEVGRVAPEGDFQGLKKLVHTGQKRLWTGNNTCTNKVKVTKREELSTIQPKPYANINSKYKKTNNQRTQRLHTLKKKTV